MSGGERQGYNHSPITPAGYVAAGPAKQRRRRSRRRRRDAMVIPVVWLIVVVHVSKETYALSEKALETMSTADIDFYYGIMPAAQNESSSRICTWHDEIAPAARHHASFMVDPPLTPPALTEGMPSFDGLVELLRKTTMVGGTQHSEKKTTEEETVVATAKEIIENAVHLFYSSGFNSTTSSTVIVNNGISAPLLLATKKESSPIDIVAPTKEEATYTGGPIIIGMEQCESFRRRWGANTTARIAGTFNTGTNAVLHNLQLNLGNPKHHQPFKTVPWWKHNPKIFTQGVGRDPIEHANVLPIVVIRDPFFWRKSTCTNSYDLSWAGRTGRECPVITMNPRSIHGKGIAIKFGGKSLDDALRLEHGLQARIPETTQSWPSLYHVWNDFYNQYLHAPFPRLIVRYEDTMLHLPQVIHAIQACIGADWKSEALLNETKAPFVTISSPGTHGHHPVTAVRVLTAPAKTHGNTKRGETLVDVLKKNTDATQRYFEMNHDEIEYSREALDPELMRIFHYTYITDDLALQPPPPFSERS